MIFKVNITIFAANWAWLTLFSPIYPIIRYWTWVLVIWRVIYIRITVKIGIAYKTVGGSSTVWIIIT